jgi:chromosome segregation protein
MNHSPRFWAQVERVLPHWRKERKWLKDHGEELMQRMNLLDKEVYRLGSQKEKASEGREERSAYMWEEYSLTPSEVRALSPDVKDEDRGQIRKQISGLKSEIKGLGNINVNAIEEYKEVSERYEFLTAQHEDLIRSEDTLTGIITELDEGMRRQFSEKFAEIRTEFDQAFQELFGGGHGTIDIDPNADILDASISIIAHPPGKKLQNMMQLSGGEKALTAIALLFAIQNLKPSPFCLLDEIEAALDESNVGHFAEYLHKLTKNTQFIIITHRRGTMTSCDRLYGITMQEKGVSALVSVNLIEDKLSK